MATAFIKRPMPRGGTLSSRIVSDVREAVFDKRLRPGDFLGSEAELAERFGVSRITVRDALRSLSATGIVEIRQGAGGGARIAASDLDHFSDALAVQFQLTGIGVGETLEAQSAIESMAAELAAKGRTAGDLARLAEALAEATTLVEDPPAFTRASLQFHLGVAEASGNRALVSLLSALRYVVWPQENPRATKDVAARVQRAHRAIYERIEARDGPGAREAMSRHVGGIRARRTSKKRPMGSAPYC